MKTEQTFLTNDEIRHLTGFVFFERQIAQLKEMGLPFWVNGRGKPVVPRHVIDGSTKQVQNEKTITLEFTS